jgi:hypothetical protein
MFFDSRNTRVRSSPPIVIDGRVAEGARDAEPIDLWDAWLFAAAAATLALAAWRFAPEADKRASYTAYVAALDREEQAARVLTVRLQA